MPHPNENHPNHQQETIQERISELSQRANPEDPWQHRSQGMQCVSCMWFVQKRPTANVALGQPFVGRCRRHAPTMNGYPVVYATDWCGDHKLDENKR